MIMGDNTMESQKMWKNAPLALGAVLLALVSIFGFIEGIPFAMKNDVSKQLESFDKKYEEKVEELKEKQALLETLKNQDNQWYREVAEDVAVLKTDTKNTREDIGEVKTDIREIKQLLRGRSDLGRR